MLKTKWSSTNEAEINAPLGEESSEYDVDLYINYQDGHGAAQMRHVGDIQVSI